MLESEIPRKIQIKVDFIKIGEIDMMNDKFTCEILIESKWFDKDRSILTNYDPSRHWNPKIYIQNIISDPKETTKYEVITNENGVMITETIRVKGQFWERIELHDFPFDLQQLNVVIRSKLKSNEICFESDLENYSLMNRDAKRSFVDQQKWELHDIVKFSDSIKRKNKWSNMKITKPEPKVSIEMQKTKSPKLIATFYCTRHPDFYLFNAFLLIFLITASSLTVFSISKSLPTNRLPTTYTILLSSISFKWVINRSLPPVSYLTFLDKYSIICICYINVVAAWHSIIGSFYNQWPSDVDFWVMIAFVCIFVCLHICFISWYIYVTRWIRYLNQEERRFIKEYLKKANKTTLYDEEEDEDPPDTDDSLMLNTETHSAPVSVPAKLFQLR